MCGINGIFAYHYAANLPDPKELLATRDHMRRRGPDGAGEFWSKTRRCALGHRRLAIIDVNERSGQPMDDGAGLTITFNGEIYNYASLRAELLAAGVEFRTNSDTEVLLQLFRREGQAMLSRLRGMFAFAIWDEGTQRLFLARDPYGIKPLYTADDGWTFRFASQVKALLAGGKVSRDPEPAGIVGFHIFGAVPEPFTLYQEIRCLPAGHFQWVGALGSEESIAYVSIAEEIAAGSTNPIAPEEMESKVRVALLDSVRAHLVADVEVGVFLSAGIDSGAILGLMRDAGQGRATALTLAFEEFSGTPEDEVPLAKRVAELYGAEHHVRMVTKAEFAAELPTILDAMDQPSIDGINTWFVAKAAREAGLKVVLSGLGGDELLAGYPSFRDIPRWVAFLRVPWLVPGFGVTVREVIRRLDFQKRSPKAAGLIEFGGSYAGAYLLKRALRLPFELKEVLTLETFDTGIRRLKPLQLLESSVMPDPGSKVGRVAALEASNYLRNQLLRDADWAGMAHSVEIRTPLVDIVVLRALASAMPRLAPGAGKVALAAAPSVPLPKALAKRAKTGFGVPMGSWLLRPVANKGAASRSWSRTVFAEYAEGSRGQAV